MTATFPSQCPFCCKQIKRGMEIVKHPNVDKRWIHKSCAQTSKKVEKSQFHCEKCGNARNECEC